jgi:hypothetical protein
LTAGLRLRIERGRSCKKPWMEADGDADMEKTGYTGAWGIEVLSAELRPKPLEEAVTRTYKTTITQFRE